MFDRQEFLTEHQNSHTSTQANHEKQLRLALEQKVRSLLSGLSSLFNLKLGRMPDGTLHESFDPLEVLKQIHESMNMTTRYLWHLSADQISPYSHTAPVISKPMPRQSPYSGHTPHSNDNNIRPEHNSALSGLAALTSVVETKEDESEGSEESPRHSFELQYVYWVNKIWH